MISMEEAGQVRAQLLRVLAEDAHNTNRLLQRLDSIGRESGIGAYAAHGRRVKVFEPADFEKTDVTRCARSC